MGIDFYKGYILPYAGIIIKICRAYTNSQEEFEDYYQEVCLQIWRSKDQFQEQSEWSTWIYRISLNVCLTTLRKDKKTKRVTVEMPSGMPEPTARIISSEIDSEQLLDALYTAIKQLSEIDRAIILLYLDEKPYKEIARIIGTSPNNIGVRITRIKERLTKIVSEKE